jgi:hypothetical protein
MEALLNMSVLLDLDEHMHAMNREQERLRTFRVNDNLWPHHTPTPYDMARAGFFYNETSDVTTCFACLRVFYNWKDVDQPLFEHLRLSPHCPFLRQLASGVQIGNALISGAHKARYTVDDIREYYGVKPFKPPKFPSLVTHPARLKTFTNWPKEEVVSAASLAEAGFFYLGKQDAVTCFHCGESLGNWCKDDIPTDEHRKWFPDCPLNEAKTPAAADTTPELLMCKVCLTNVATIAVLPCGHFAACSTCTTLFTKCPICRHSILGTVRVFVP